MWICPAMQILHGGSVDGTGALFCGHLGRATLGLFKDVHAILGVRPGASLQEVKAAYKRYASSLKRC